MGGYRSRKNCNIIIMQGQSAQLIVYVYVISATSFDLTVGHYKALQIV